MPKDKIINPNHLPKINPPNIATGDINPAAKTQIITKNKKNIDNKRIFDCFKSKK